MVRNGLKIRDRIDAASKLFGNWAFQLRFRFSLSAGCAFGGLLAPPHLPPRHFWTCFVANTFASRAIEDRWYAREKTNFSSALTACLCACFASAARAIQPVAFGLWLANARWQRSNTKPTKPALPRWTARQKRCQTMWWSVCWKAAWMRFDSLMLVFR